MNTAPLPKRYAVVLTPHEAAVEITGWPQELWLAIRVGEGSTEFMTFTDDRLNSGLDEFLLGIPVHPSFPGHVTVLLPPEEEDRILAWVRDNNAGLLAHAAESLANRAPPIGWARPLNVRPDAVEMRQQPGGLHLRVGWKVASIMGWTEGTRIYTISDGHPLRLGIQAGSRGVPLTICDDPSPHEKAASLETTRPLMSVPADLIGILGPDWRKTAFRVEGPILVSEFPPTPPSPIAEGSKKTRNFHRGIYLSLFVAMPLTLLAWFLSKHWN
jgi:hypothetical protein